MYNFSPPNAGLLSGCVANVLHSAVAVIGPAMHSPYPPIDMCEIQTATMVIIKCSRGPLMHDFISSFLLALSESATVSGPLLVDQSMLIMQSFIVSLVNGDQSNPH